IVVRLHRYELSEHCWLGNALLDPLTSARLLASDLSLPVQIMKASLCLLASIIMFTLSPGASPSASAAQKENRFFEMRTYYAAPGKLEALLARFRNHTTKLFEKHGMTNFAYWVPTETRDGAGSTLIYILAHKDSEAAAESFKTFRADPEWVKVKAESEADG